MGQRTRVDEPKKRVERRREERFGSAIGFKEGRGIDSFS